MTLFSPRRADGRAEWKVIADHALLMTYGEELTYETIAILLETNDRQVAYRAVRECNRHFLADRTSRALRPVRGKGYRVLSPSEYAPQALAEKRAATRKLSGAVDLMRSAPMQDMSPGMRQWANTVSMALVDHELRLMGMEQRADFADERIAELERRAGIRTPKIVNGEAESA